MLSKRKLHTKLISSLLSPNYQRLLIICSILIFSIFFGILGLGRHLSLKDNLNDLGNFDQALFTTTKGYFMINSNFAAAQDQSYPNRFSKHSNYTLFFLVPFYYLFSDPKILILFQSFMIGLGALPLYLLGKQIFPTKTPYPLLTPLLFLANHTVHTITLFDFHPLSIVMTLIIFALYFLHQRKYSYLCFLVSIIALTKEELPLFGFFVGLYIFIFQKKYKLGLSISILAGIFFFVNLNYLMPFFSGNDVPLLLANRYSHLGKNAGEIILTIATKPFFVLSELISPLKILYLFLLFAPLLFLSLLQLDILLIGLPSLLANLLSNNPIMHFPFEYYHAAPLVAIIFVTSTFGLSNIIRDNNSDKLKKGLSQGIIASTLLLTLLFSPAPISLFVKTDEYTINNTAKKIDLLKEYIPEEASLTVQNNLGSHFSQRLSIYVFPHNTQKTDYTLLLVQDTNPRRTTFPRPRGFLFDVQTSPQNYYDSTIDLFENSEYGVEYFTEDGYLLFKKNCSKEKNELARTMFEREFKKLMSQYPEHTINYN